MKKLISMKQINRLCLIMLLMVIGGVEVEAQILYKSWDFTNANKATLTTVEGATDTLYQDVDISNLNIKEDGNGTSKNLAFKGNTEIDRSSSGGYLKINSRGNEADMRNGVRIPAPQGYIVKVTGSAESTNETYTWVGAEIDTNLGEEMFWNKQETTVAGVAISGEMCDRVQNYVAIENQRYGAAKVEAELVHTASASWGANKTNKYTPNTVDSEAELYNNETPDAWAGVAFAEFDISNISVPDNATNFKATLHWTAIAGTNSGAERNNTVYCLNIGQSVSYNDILDKNKENDAYLYKGNKTEVWNFKIEQGTNPGTKQDESFDVTDFVQNFIENGQQNIIFQWTNNSGGAYLAGKASENAPKLIIEYTIGNGDPRPLYIYKIEVYEPNNDFNFKVSDEVEVKSDEDGNMLTIDENYKIYNQTIGESEQVLRGYVLRDESRKTLPVKLVGFPEGIENTTVETPLTKQMFKEWDGTGHTANAVKNIDCVLAVSSENELAPGSVVYGVSNGTVPKLDYADISKADALQIKGTPGLPLHIVFNRVIDNSDQDTDDNDQDTDNSDQNIDNVVEYESVDEVIGNNGVLEVKFDKYEYVHLNVIKVAYKGVSGKVTALNLVSQGINYTCDFKGDIVNAKLNKETGEISNIEGAGGAIVVKAVYEDPNTHIESNAEYVITVPYTVKEWDFRETETKSNLYTNTASLSDWGLTWKVYRRKDGISTNPIEQLSHSVLSNAVPISGDNARFIDQTAGLIFETPAYSFGTNVTVNDYDNGTADPDKRAHVRATYNSANNVLDVMNNAVTMKTATKLVIPNLKKGQHIRFRWNCHDNKDNTGDGMKATNVYDLTGTEKVDVFYTGSGSNANSAQAHQEFVVADDGDVSFTLKGGKQGWSNIYNIVVADGFIGTDLNIDTVDKEDITDKDENGNVVVVGTIDYNVPDNPGFSYNGHPVLYTYLRKAGKEPIKTKFTDARGKIHMQSSLNQQFEIADYTGTLNAQNCRMGTGDDWNILYIEPNAHGSFTLIQKGVQNTGQYTDSKPYLLDSLRVKVEVYEYDYNEKPYPYTWAMENFTTNTGNNTVVELGQDQTVKTLDKYNTRKITDMSYWTRNGNSYKFNVGYPENMIALKKRTSQGNIEQTVTYAMQEGETMISGQTVPVKHDDETVATVTFGERCERGNKLTQNEQGGNIPEFYKEGAIFNAATKDNEGKVYTTGNNVDVKGDEKGGTFYTIIPKYDGEITVDVVQNGGDFRVEENGTVLNNGGNTFSVKEGQHYKVYAENAQLGFSGFRYTYKTGGELFIPEFDGFGIMPKDYWDKGTDNENLTLTPLHTGLEFKSREYTLKVPNVQKGQTLYLAVTDDMGKSILANDVKYEPVREGYVYEYGDYILYPALNIYEIKGEGGDIDLTLKNLTLHKMAVSVDAKTVTSVGWATEAREYPLDITLARLFLGKDRELRAYQVTGTKDDKVSLSDVQYVPMTIDNSGALTEKPENNNGIVLKVPEELDAKYKNQDGFSSWPLFTTDINRGASDMSSNQLVGIVAQESVYKVINEGNEDKVKILDQKDEKGYYNYLLANQGNVVEYEDDNREGDYNSTEDEVVGDVSGLGFYLILKSGTKLQDGSPYKGGLPKDNTAYLKLSQRWARINQTDEPPVGNNTETVNMAGIRQVFFIDVDSILTDIDEIPVYDDGDDELPTTENIATLLQNGVFYTLQGMPVKNPTKGIYIFNGKKVYVK